MEFTASKVHAEGHAQKKSSQLHDAWFDKSENNMLCCTELLLLSSFICMP